MTLATAPTTGHSAPRPGILLLVAISAINPLGINMFMPSMPAMVHVFRTDYAQVQLALSLYLASVAVAQIVIGSVSDRLGRRPVLLAGLSLFLFGTLVCLMATTIEVLLLGRILQGAGGCAGIVLARAIVRDMYDREQAASMIGYVTMGMAVAPMIAPAIGGVLEEAFGWTASFQVLFVFGVIVLVAALFNLHETHVPDRTQRGPGIWQSFTILARLPLFWAYTGTAAFTSAVFFSFIGGAPLVMDRILGGSPTAYGLYFAFVSAGYVIGNFISGRFAARIGLVRMILVGNTIMLTSVGMIGAGFAVGLHHPATLFAPMLLCGLGNGMTLPSSIAGTVSLRPDLAGAASGIGGSMHMGLGALSSALAGALLEILWPGTVWALVLVMAIAALLGVVSGFAIAALQKTAQGR